MSDDSVDVIVPGGGIAGMVSAIAFAQAGFQPLCVDPMLAVTSRADDGADLRTTAFLAGVAIDKCTLYEMIMEKVHKPK